MPKMIGWFDLPEQAPSGDAYHAFARSAFHAFARHAEVLDLLLSFAHRRHVQIRDPAIYVLENEQWIYRGGGALYADFAGRSDGGAWYHGDAELRAFLAHAYSRMIDDFDEVRGGTEKTGLRLALRLLDSSRGDISAELSFLEAAIALDVLVNASQYSRTILEKHQFDAVHETLTAALTQLPGELNLTAEQVKAVTKQIPGLNYANFIDRAEPFLQTVLYGHSQQSVRRKDLRCFIEIRNAITHYGSMKDAAENCGVPKEMKGDYAYVLLSQYQRLVSLLERVVLALLTVETDLMTIPWQDVRGG